MTDSLRPIATPTRSTDSLDRSYRRTDVQTHADPLSPTSETSPFVTRTRTYGFAEGDRHEAWQDDETGELVCIHCGEVKR